MTAAKAGPALGVIVCCRDEERVIERRVRNLALSQWPGSSRPHAIVVVDDGSSDRTQALARAAGEGAFPQNVHFEVLANGVRSGKSGAIEAAIRRLSGRVDLLLLTDADVVNDPESLGILAEAFQRDPRLAMACGSQRFVSNLSHSGALDPRLSRWRGDWYDGITALVRRLESRSGRVFSVHGQLLAWRAELGLSPREGLAADDLDLMRQARLLGGRVELLAPARFFEVKPKQRKQRWIQGLRRARAYVQFVHTLDPSAAGDLGTRWQWRFYKHVPTAVPWVAGVLLLAILTAVAWQMSHARELRANELFYLGYFLALVVVCSGLWRLCYLIQAAKRLERAQPMDDRWTTAR